MLLVDMSLLVAIGHWYLLISCSLSYVFSYTFMICLSAEVLEQMLSYSESSRECAFHCKLAFKYAELERRIYDIFS